jgi:nucleotidyltransferase/DNA polymerase involved in DNA repair
LDLCCLDHTHVSHDPLQCIALLQFNISQKLIGAVKQIPPRAVPGLMQMLPLRKIKLLGGKLGEEMKQKWGCLTAGDAQQIPQAELMACFGERLGTYAWKAVRGFQADKGDHTGH